MYEGDVDLCGLACSRKRIGDRVTKPLPTDKRNDRLAMERDRKEIGKSARGDPFKHRFIIRLRIRSLSYTSTSLFSMVQGEHESIQPLPRLLCMPSSDNCATTELRLVTIPLLFRSQTLSLLFRFHFLRIYPTLTLIPRD